MSRAIGSLLVRLIFKAGSISPSSRSGLAVWVAVSLVLGAAASFLPAWHASRRPVREALGYE